MILGTIKWIFTKACLFLDTIHPVLPKASDNFAFRNEAERANYYNKYGTLSHKPTEKFTIIKLIVILVQGMLIFIGWLLCFFLLYYLLNGW